jgi:hypothetical protein
MADTGINWPAAWSFAKDAGGGDWDADAIADGADIISNTAISLDGYVGAIIGVSLVEDNTGAVDADGVDIFILGHSGDGDEEVTSGVGSPLKIKLLAVQNDTVEFQFSISALDYDDFKIALSNDCGQELSTTVQYKLGSVPVAS